MKKIFSFLLIFVIIFTLVACDDVEPEKVNNDTSNGANEQNSSQKDKDIDKDKKDDDSAKNTVFNVGDTIKMGDLQYTVSGIRITNGGDFLKPDEGNHYIYIEIVIDNTGDKEANISSMLMFKLVDSEGVSHGIALVGDTKGNVDGALAPGRRMKGEVVYEVPTSINDFELEINPTLGTGLAVVKIPNDNVEGEAPSKPASSSNDAFKIEDVIKMENLQFTVKGTRTSSGNDFLKPDEGHQYLYVDILIENVGNDEEHVSSILMFKLVDLDGTNYNATIVTDSEGQVDGALASGRKMRGEIVYEVPVDIKEFELQIDPSFGKGLAYVKIPVE